MNQVNPLKLEYLVMVTLVINKRKSNRILVALSKKHCQEIPFHVQESHACNQLVCYRMFTLLYNK